MKKKLVYPSHFQLSFYADFLESFVSSSEQTVQNVARLYNEISWQKGDLPSVYTPINDMELVSDKRIILLLWITNENSNQEVIGLVNLKLDVLQKQTYSSMGAKVRDV